MNSQWGLALNQLIKTAKFAPHELQQVSWKSLRFMQEFQKVFRPVHFILYFILIQIPFEIKCIFPHEFTLKKKHEDRLKACFEFKRNFAQKVWFCVIRPEKGFFMIFLNGKQTVSLWTSEPLLKWPLGSWLPLWPRLLSSSSVWPDGWR